MQHVTVLLHEVLEWIAPRAGGCYLDGTTGLGGHSAAILEAVQGQARLLCLDRDPQALALAEERLAPWKGSVVFEQACYSEFPAVMRSLGWQGLDGAVLDLGVSSLQLDEPERGFSFLHDGPLDMRMSPGGPEQPASRLVNKAGVDELKRIIWRYGEEPQAGRIARAIAQERVSRPIETTARLADIVERAYPAKWRATARNHSTGSIVHATTATGCQTGPCSTDCEGTQHIRSRRRVECPRLAGPDARARRGGAGQLVPRRGGGSR